MTRTIYDKRWLQAKQLATGSSFEVVEIGWEQHVLIDHKKNLVYRYPRTANAAAKLIDEVSVLKSLHRMNLPFKIPVLIEHTANYTVYEYIKGDVLTPQIIQTLTAQQIKMIGKEAGVFLAALHSADKQIVTTKQTKQTITLYEYYRSRILYAEGSELFQAAWADFEVIKEPTVRDLVVVHGDLYGPNMVIDPDSKNLVGVIDFSELEIGDPHQEFRKLFMTDPDLLEPAVIAYAKITGNDLDLNTIKHWAYANEWANVCFFKDTPDNLTYQRAINHLRVWGKTVEAVRLA